MIEQMYNESFILTLLLLTFFIGMVCDGLLLKIFENGTRITKIGRIYFWFIYFIINILIIAFVLFFRLFAIIFKKKARNNKKIVKWYTKLPPSQLLRFGEAVRFYGIEILTSLGISLLVSPFVVFLVGINKKLLIPLVIISFFSIIIIILRNLGYKNKSKPYIYISIAIIIFAFIYSLIIVLKGG